MEDMETLRNGFVRVRPQLARHSSGFTVGGKDRFHLTYKDVDGEVIIYVDAGFKDGKVHSYALYPNVMYRLLRDGGKRPVTPEERSKILPRAVAGFSVLVDVPIELSDQAEV